MARDYERIESRALDAEVIVIPLIFGLLFGFFCVKGGVFLPSVIIGFLKWENFIFLKFYLAAIIAALATGSLCSLIRGDCRSRFECSRIVNAYGGLPMLLGAVCMGFGMSICAAEPGTVFVQIGAGNWHSLYIILGGVIAVVVYGFLYHSLFSSMDSVFHYETSTLDGAMRCEYWIVAAPVAVLLGFLCYMMEKKWAPGMNGDKWVPNIKDKKWNVYLAGGMCGLFMLPLRISLFTVIDATYAYVSPITVPLRSCWRELPLWFDRHSHRGGLWVLFFFLSAGGGAAVACSLSKSWAEENYAKPHWNVLGGFLLILGSLLAHCCSTGMALSGMSDLNLCRTLGTVIIYGCGIGAWAILKSDKVHFDPQKSFLSSTH